MKYAVGLAIAMLSSSVAMSSEEQLIKPEAVCSSTGVADAGYEIIIKKDQGTGKLFATVLEESIIGTKRIGKIRVEQLNRGTQRAYKSLDLSLNVNLITTGEQPVGEGHLGQAFGKLLKQKEFGKMTCSLSNPAPIVEKPTAPGGITCQAFFTGFVFNAQSGRCEFRSQSGCSNPFEFHNLPQCENAFSTIR